MAFWVYLKGTYKHRFNRHLRLILIFICLMFLPLSLSIYRDSIIQGNDLYNNRPHEYDLRIFNAKSEHLPFFEHISNVSFTVQDNYIGVNIPTDYAISDETAHLSDLWDIGWSSVDIVAVLLNEPINEIRNNGDTDVFLFSGNPGTAELFVFAHILMFFIIALLVLSIGVLIYIERSHIKSFMSDIGVMLAYGAEKKHLRYIFIVDYIFTFILSAFIALGFSLLFMFFIVTNIVQTTVVGTTWVVFNANLFNIAAYILAFFILGFITLNLMVSKTLKNTSKYLISSVDEGIESARRKERITMQKPTTTLISIFSKRTKSIRSALIIAVPLTVVIIAVFNFMANMLYYEFPPLDTHLVIEKISGYEVIVNSDDGANYHWQSVDTPGFSEEDTAFVRNIKSVVDFEIQETEFVDLMWIAIDDVQESNTVYNLLLDHFDDNVLYSIIDNVARFEADRDMQTGLYILTMLVFSVLFIVVLIIIYISITGYVETQSKNIYQLRLIGADDTDIFQSFMIKTFDNATIGMIISFVLGIGIFNCLSYITYTLIGDEIKIIFNTQTIIIQLFIVALFYIAFLLPMFVSVKKILNTELCETRRKIL